MSADELRERARIMAERWLASPPRSAEEAFTMSLLRELLEQLDQRLAKRG